MFFCETNTSILCIPMRTTHLSWPLTKRNQILPTDEVHPVFKTNFHSKQNEGYKCFFVKTNKSISCIPMRTTHLSYPLVIRNQILSIDEIHPVLRTNFDSKQNEGYKCFFRETNASISCIPMRTTHFSWSLMKRNQILSTNEVHPILRINFDSKQNESYKCFFCETKA